MDATDGFYGKGPKMHGGKKNQSELPPLKSPYIQIAQSEEGQSELQAYSESGSRT